ncbi:hypothetical protein TCDM_01979 [Trypanosoma cruzi Dm28c]|uniref:PH domain-containing protein n=2 Tax=Trypanosoma cruzi TaxID=5693 RepID=V5BXG5_TRYCR|nr:hypothetical protein TCDM_01979 [Trypanosoma cruzi Dm28c]PBJ79226.1 hypothetical protein BCY84_03183 [Trypanosoma cruzi cruzi]PWU96314.1 hypothetical protein C4B63_19g175 [Trypanosoma cruzi]
MTVHVHWLNGVPACEGWIEKYSVGRSFFSRKSWQMRYVVVTSEGIGYTHKIPNRCMKPSSARCFVPFEGPPRSNGGIHLRPVYLLRHVTPSMHPEVPDGCQKALSCTFSGSDVSFEHHYFAISFEERKKRLFLLLRTKSLEDYNVWTLVLSVYVPAGSIKTVVPVPHPLENYRHGSAYFFNSKKGFFKIWDNVINVATAGFYMVDPDPCTAAELGRIKKLVLSWDEGEAFRWQSLRSGETSTSHRTTILQEENEEEWRKLLSVAAELDAVCGPTEESTEYTE